MQHAALTNLSKVTSIPLKVEQLIGAKSKQSRGWLNQIAVQQWIQFRQRSSIYIYKSIYLHSQTLVYQWL